MINKKYLSLTIRNKLIEDEIKLIEADSETSNQADKNQENSISHEDHNTLFPEIKVAVTCRNYI